MLRRMATVVAATTALVLVGASSALAQSTININPAHTNTTAAEFEEGENCPDGEFGPLDLDQNEDGWHFILPAAAGDNFTSLSLTFEDLNGDPVNVVIDDRAPAISSGAGWSGYITATGAGDFRHAWLVTEAGWELKAGTADIEETAGKKARFNLSHVCAGVPTTPTEKPTDKPTEKPTEKPTTPPSEKPETPKPVPTSVPAGYGKADNGSASTIGVLAFLTVLAAGAGTLVTRRFLKDN